MTTNDAVHAALRAWAKGIYPTEAAVELLIRAGLATSDATWIQPGDDPRWWCVGFEELAADLDAGTVHSGGERRMLCIAASLGGHSPQGFNLSDALPGLDRAHLALVLAAVAHAGGSHEHTDTSALEVAAETGQPLDMAALRTPLGALYPWPSESR